MYDTLSEGMCDTDAAGCRLQTYECSLFFFIYRSLLPRPYSVGASDILGVTIL